MSLVVCGMYPSVGAAYQGYKKVVGVSKVALYAKINGLEPRISQALVRYSSEELTGVKAEFKEGKKKILEGYIRKANSSWRLASHTVDEFA